ncbi:hypothetical protein ETD86_37440 [Nonomuraea turkmeniaca]|uniref:Uncharacterized protein n=1 Tax=Nonomuraea turkmeniaca TaxID=103838 RepID=A0A5S4F4C6_9ACTN|nr:hypothetical protein [Nonomuraea turkmeniaca]TMR11002.1 hypothetical protein ETD86_37440 [Nonomuraea turkmeniaca]
MTDLGLNERFVLIHKGRSMYYVGDALGHRFNGRDTITVYADDQPMTPLRRPGWYAADSVGPHRIAVHVPRPDRILGYTLSDPTAESPRFPGTLTPDEYRERADASDIWYQLYTPAYEGVDPDVITVPGPWTVLTDGPFPPDDAAGTWHPSLPTELTRRPEYHFLFPGHLFGLRAALQARIREMPHVEYCHEQERKLDVTIKVPLQVPEHEWVTPIYSPRRRGKKVQREITITRRLSLAVPDGVSGSSYSAARKAWDEQIAHWTGIVTAASAKGCNACQGRGYVIVGSEEHNRL